VAIPFDAWTVERIEACACAAGVHVMATNRQHARVKS
jgi:hypothetical protein